MSAEQATVAHHPPSAVHSICFCCLSFALVCAFLQGRGECVRVRERRVEGGGERGGEEMEG
jgi:hypothetical protein